MAQQTAQYEALQYGQDKIPDFGAIAMAGAKRVTELQEAERKRKDEELRGCRVFTTEKNRFGGCGHTFFLQLKEDGFSELGRISDAS